MKRDYLPQSDATAVAWLTNFKTKLSTHATALGILPAEVTAAQADCTGWISSVNNVEARRTELASAVEARDQISGQSGTNLRERIRKIKTAAGYTESIGQDLGIVSAGSELDTENFKATISAERFAGHIRIKFVKGDTDGINLYHRKKGESAWKFLARDTKSPYDDHITLTAEGQPEHWEYRAYGVVNDAQIGQPSDIVEMVFGG